MDREDVEGGGPKAPNYQDGTDRVGRPEGPGEGFDVPGRSPGPRGLFIPDEGMIMFDADLQRADAQVVAWEANDKSLMAAFAREAVDPTYDTHMENAKDIFGDWAGKPERVLAKKGVHATNYGCTARTLGISLGITTKKAEEFQSGWFEAHPGIKEWHRRIHEELMTSKTVTNKFGYRRTYLDRVEGMLPEALAWIPQSTVACVINRALERIDRELPWVELLLQVHDSLVGQFPVEKEGVARIVIPETMRVVIPYDEVLIIPVSMKTSIKNWADCK